MTGPSHASWTVTPDDREIPTAALVALAALLLLALCVALVVGQRKVEPPTLCERAAAAGYVEQCRAETGAQ